MVGSTYTSKQLCMWRVNQKPIQSTNHSLSIKTVFFKNSLPLNKSEYIEGTSSAYNPTYNHGLDSGAKVIELIHSYSCTCMTQHRTALRQHFRISFITIIVTHRYTVHVPLIGELKWQSGHLTGGTCRLPDTQA